MEEFFIAVYLRIEQRRERRLYKYRILNNGETVVIFKNESNVWTIAKLIFNHQEQ